MRYKVVSTRATLLHDTSQREFNTSNASDTVACDTKPCQHEQQNAVESSSYSTVRYGTTPLLRCAILTQAAPLLAAQVNTSNTFARAAQRANQYDQHWCMVGRYTENASNTVACYTKADSTDKQHCRVLHKSRSNRQATLLHAVRKAI